MDSERILLAKKNPTPKAAGVRAHPIACVFSEFAYPRMFDSAPDEIQHGLAPPVRYEPLRSRSPLCALLHHQLHEATLVLCGSWIHHVLHEVIQVEGILAIRLAVPVNPSKQDTTLIGVLLDEGLKGEQLVRLYPTPRWIRDRRALRPETAEVQAQWVVALVVRAF